MLLGGLQKTTLIDFPGKVACTVFTVGCNFRCPFCHNKDIVSQKNFLAANLPPIKESEFFSFLHSRKKILDGVCITGGEPTLHSDLMSFCEKIKQIGLAVKLDSNGSNPDKLKNLIKNNLVDFIAMDVKACFSDYKKAMGVNYPVSQMKKSIILILNSGLGYELRTTLVPKIHSQKSIIKLTKDLKQLAKKIKYPLSKLNYTLQSFRPQNCLDPKYLKERTFSSQELKEILRLVKIILPKTKFKGEMF
jgi:pyruvate formate lyase activating enzyme